MRGGAKDVDNGQIFAKREGKEILIFNRMEFDMPSPPLVASTYPSQILTVGDNSGKMLRSVLRY